MYYNITIDLIVSNDKLAWDLWVVINIKIHLKV